MITLGSMPSRPAAESFSSLMIFIISSSSTEWSMRDWGESIVLAEMLLRLSDEVCSKIRTNIDEVVIEDAGNGCGIRHHLPIMDDTPERATGSGMYERFGYFPLTLYIISHLQLFCDISSFNSLEYFTDFVPGMPCISLNCIHLECAWIPCSLFLSLITVKTDGVMNEVNYHDSYHSACESYKLMTQLISFCKTEWMNF